MRVDADYSADQEFTKLLARRSDVDLTVAALELARDACPRLCFHETLDWIDRCAEEIHGSISAAWTEEDAIKRIAAKISIEHGIFGDSQAYHKAKSSYLPDVITGKRGIPISLSVLYMAVSERVGLELHGVAAPLHFLARFEATDGPMFVDAFDHGRVMAWDQCVDWLVDITTLDSNHVVEYMEPVDSRSIITRMLNNLKLLHARNEDWQAAYNVQQRLTSLQPSSYRERRDYGVISIKANRPGQAIGILRECLESCPEDETELLEQQIEEAAGQVRNWN